MTEKADVLIRPSIISQRLWNTERHKLPIKARNAVLLRDDYTCCGCGHRALKYMNVHHVSGNTNDSLENLVLLCVACHAVLHIGRNLSLGAIQIWQTSTSQIEIIRQKRAGVAMGRSLAEINKRFDLVRGEHTPDAIEYANELLARVGDSPTASLPEPLSVVFVNFSRWQIE
jgi:hypothetical protein